MMRRLVGIVIVLVVLGLFSGTLYYLYRKSEKPPVLHATQTPSVTSIVNKTAATGAVIPRKEVAIKPVVSGIIDRIHVEPGEVVKRGQAIAQIRIIPNTIALSAAEHRLLQARIADTNAERERLRHQRLLEEGTIADAEYRRHERAWQSARQEVDGAEEHLQLVREGSTKKAGATANTVVRATIDGMVLEVPREEGDAVIEANTFNEGTTIATIADMDELSFEGKVDESEVGKIREGMQLSLTIGALEGERFAAQLERIAPKGIEENGAIQFEVRAALAPREDLFVRANYSANADIVLDRRDDVLAIDESLLQFDGERPFVEVQTAPGLFERRDLVTGLSDGIKIEVVSGLTAEDRIKVPNPAR